MESAMAARFVTFTRDVDNWGERETMQKLRELKRDVVAEERSLKTARARVASLAAWAACVSVGVRSVLQRDARRQKHWINDSVFLMEDAVMTSSHTLREDAMAATAATVPTLSSAATPNVDAAAFQRVVASTTSVHTVAATAWIELGSLLALCWILPTPAKPTPTKPTVYRVVDLLDAIISHCRRHASLTRHAACPLLLQALVLAVHGKDEPRARQCLQEAVSIASREAPGTLMGALSYWYAVLLSREPGATDTAIEQLRVAVAHNYNVVAALNLQALLAVQQGDLHEAAAALERGMEIDFDIAISMYNYAVLLKRMGSSEAQYEMLAFYTEATAPALEDETGETDGGGRKTMEVETDNVEIFRDCDTARLFSSQRRSIESGDVALEMAMAAAASGSWQAARERFQDYFTTLDGHSPPRVSQTTRRTFIYVLLQCNRPTEALAQCELATEEEEEDVWVHFYKADALLCLERVDECAAHLASVIQPLVANRLGTQRCSSLDTEELGSLHTQLLNNLAIAQVCCGEIDAAVATLRDCSRQYPRDLAVQFNLTLLLWRLGRHDAACAVWFQARGWNPQMDVGDMRNQQKALDWVAQVENEALSSATHAKIDAHVSDSSATSGAVHDRQLRSLDALVLHHWGTAQDALVAKTAAQYVDFLETLTAKAKAKSTGP